MSCWAIPNYLPKTNNPLDNWTLHKLEAHFIEVLEELYDSGEARSLCRLLAEDQLGLSPTRLLAARDQKLASDDADRILHHLPALKSGTPVQYLLGYAWFMDMKLRVSPSVLVPRPETEELVHRIASDYRATEHPLRIIDIGTGSGCIALGLKKLLPQAEVHALDVSGEALEIARANALAQQLDVQFVQGDILEWDAFVDPDLRFDIVVSNPPYITQAEAQDMHPNVLLHEPHLALFVEDEAPLLFYAHIASFAKRHLVSGGQVYAEINATLGDDTATLFRKNGFDPVSLHPDMQGKDRFVQGRKPV